MKIASTDTIETESQSGEEKAQEQKRTFLLAVAQGTFIRISFAFADSTTVLSAFVYRLTNSNTLVGLVGSIGTAGWMWPQLLISNLLEHRPRKMPLLRPRHEYPHFRVGRNFSVHSVNRS